MGREEVGREEMGREIILLEGGAWERGYASELGSLGEALGGRVAHHIDNQMLQSHEE